MNRVICIILFAIAIPLLGQTQPAAAPAREPAAETASPAPDLSRLSPGEQQELVRLVKQALDVLPPEESREANSIYSRLCERQPTTPEQEARYGALYRKGVTLLAVEQRNRLISLFAKTLVKHGPEAGEAQPAAALPTGGSNGSSTAEPLGTFVLLAMAVVGLLFLIAGCGYYLSQRRYSPRNKQSLPAVITSVSKRPVSPGSGLSKGLRYVAVAAGLGPCALVVMTAAAVTFSLPRIYEGHARILIGAREGGQEQRQSIDRLLQTHAEMLRSEPVLRGVVKEEQLIAKWAIAGPEEMATQQCVELLKKRVATEPVPGTSLIEVVAFSIDPNEAAEIANRLANSYCVSSLAKNGGGTVEMAAKATPPTTHSKPNVPLYLGVALLVGVIVGGSISGLILFLGRGMHQA